MATTFRKVPDWGNWQNQGAGIAAADLDGSGRPDLVVLRVDAAAGANRAHYRVGRSLDAAGEVKGGWSGWTPVPDWGSHENEGADIAVADVDGDGRPELIVLRVDAPAGQNQAYYRIGWNLSAAGTVSGWSEWKQIPGWFGWLNQGAGLAVADLDGDGRPELVVLVVDAPAGKNQGYYKVGRALSRTGEVTRGWTGWTGVPDWFSSENQGAALALADLDGDGRAEMIVLKVDNPKQGNGAYVTIGWGVDSGLRPADGWGPWTRLPDWPFWENQGAGLALADLRGSGRPELIVATVDNPAGQNSCQFAALNLTTDLDDAATKGVWRLLDFDSQVLAVHAALLHTGDVLFFAGSSNNPGNPHFRTRVWRYPSPEFEAPATPIDLFCCGHAFLPDGRLLAAGGTAQYDPFQGLRDALVFDPGTATWSSLPDMAAGRWYPALLTLPDGRVLALSGATVILPPARDQRVMVLGGGGHSEEHHHGMGGVSDVAVADLSGPAPRYQPAADLHEARMHLNATLLPDRTVLATGGAQIEEDAAHASRHAEIYDPATGRWTLGAAARVPRLYHSVALLTPDAKVITAGSNPERLQEEMRIEVYWPPYLFRGERPTITLAADRAAYGDSIAATSPSAGRLREINLVRPGATTHSSNNEQRLHDLPFRVSGSDAIEVDLPSDPSLAPPGWYMVFAVGAGGVPSHAAWLHLSAGA